MQLLHLQQAPRLRTWWETCSEDSTFRERQRAARGRDPHSTPAKAGCCCWLLSTAWHSSLLPLFLLPPPLLLEQQDVLYNFSLFPPPPPQTTTSRLIYPNSTFFAVSNRTRCSQRQQAGLEGLDLIFSGKANLIGLFVFILL